MSWRSLSWRDSSRTVSRISSFSRANSFCRSWISACNGVQRGVAVCDCLWCDGV